MTYVGARENRMNQIFSILNVPGPMMVYVKVHESIVDRVAPGQQVRVEVDAFPGQTMAGVVIDVAPRPDPLGPSKSRTGADVRLYTTRVRIEKGLSGLRPGMTARADILVAALENVLAVPVRSVLTRDRKTWLGVKTPDGTFELREVTLGQWGLSDGKPVDVEKLGTDGLIEVKQGLKSGDVVTTNPMLLLTEDEKRQLPAGRPEKPAATPAPPK